MAKVDFNRLLEWFLENDVAAITGINLRIALRDQHLEYKDGKIQPIPLTDEKQAYLAEMVKNGSTARYSDLVYADEDMPDIDTMVDEYIESKGGSGVFKMELDAYRKGLEDMFNKMMK